MQLAYILLLLLIAPYFCSGGFGIGGNTKGKTDEDPCQIYTCLKSLSTECKTELKKKNPSNTVSEDIWCEIFGVMTQDESTLTAEDQQDLQKIYLPFSCCILETLGLGECGDNADGQTEIKNAALDLEVIAKQIGSKCGSESLTDTLVTELGPLLSPCIAATTNEEMLECASGALKKINGACKKKPEETFCPGLEETLA